MKLKLSDIVKGTAALGRLGSEKLPVHLAYQIERNIRKINPELESYEKLRVDLVKKYGREDEQDGSYEVIEPKQLIEFNKENEALLAVEIEVDIQTIGMQQLRIDISPLDLLALEWMFVEDFQPQPGGGAKRKRH